jgi:hypothetical protein
VHGLPWPDVTPAAKSAGSDFCAPPSPHGTATTPRTAALAWSHAFFASAASAGSPGLSPQAAAGRSAASTSASEQSSRLAAVSDFACAMLFATTWPALASASASLPVAAAALRILLLPPAFVRCAGHAAAIEPSAEALADSHAVLSLSPLVTSGSASGSPPQAVASVRNPVSSASEHFCPTAAFVCLPFSGMPQEGVIAARATPVAFAQADWPSVFRSELMDSEMPRPKSEHASDTSLLVLPSACPHFVRSAAFALREPAGAPRAYEKPESVLEAGDVKFPLTELMRARVARRVLLKSIVKGFDVEGMSAQPVRSRRDDRSAIAGELTIDGAGPPILRVVEPLTTTP